MTKGQELEQSKVLCLPLSCRIKVKLICVVSEVLIYSTLSLLCTRNYCKQCVLMQKKLSNSLLSCLKGPQLPQDSGSGLLVCPNYSLNVVSLPCFVCFHQWKSLFSLPWHHITASSRTLKSKCTQSVLILSL